MDQDRIWDYFQNEGIDSFSASRPRLKYLANKIKKNEKVLNIGVGAGSFEEISLAKGIDVYSLDPNERCINELRTRLHLNNKAKIGYSDNIPFDSDVFDIVVMSEVLEHLSDSVIVSTMREIKRVLKKNGRLILTVPYNEDLNYNRVVCPKCNCIFHRWGHVRSFNKNSLEKFLLDHAFEVREIKVRSFPDWGKPGLKNYIKALAILITGWFGERVAGPCIFCVADILPIEDQNKSMES